MEWLTAVWNKINKPQHFLAVGFAILMAAPSEFKWAGWIFVAIGAVGIGEWMWAQIKKLCARHIIKQKIVAAMLALNKEEKSILINCINKNERTFYHSPNITRSVLSDYHFIAVISGLANKGIIDILHATDDGKSLALHISDQAWKLLQNPEIKKMLDT
jgi:hypothetical protein